MNHFLRGVARASAESFSLPEPIVEMGSFQVQGQESIADLRNFFPGKKYIGIDMRQGPGVDCVTDVENLPFRTASVGTVIAMNLFEHVPRFWRGFEEVYRILRQGGVFLVACPFYFHVHEYPSDYWRFTTHALDVLMADYSHRIIGTNGPLNRYLFVWGLSFKGACPDLNVRIEQYQENLKLYAKEPLRWSRIFRYNVASFLGCGRGPFSPYLDQGIWRLEVRP